MDDTSRVLVLALCASVFLCVASAAYADVWWFAVSACAVMACFVLKVITTRNRFARDAGQTDTGEVCKEEEEAFVSFAQESSFKGGIYEKLAGVWACGMLFDFMEREIRERSAPAGVILDEKKLVQMLGPYIVVGMVFPSVVAALLLSFVVTGYTDVLLPLVACVAIPLGIMFGPRTYLGILASNRKAVIEKDMLFFLPFVEILNHSGRTITATFGFVTQCNLFAGMTREITLFKRHTNVGGASDLSSLEGMAHLHPSEIFSEFVWKYVSFAKTDVAELRAYLAQSVKMTYQRFDEEMTGHAARMAGLFIIFSTSSVIGPIMIITVILFPGAVIPPGLLLAAVNTVPFLFMIFGIIATPPVQIRNKIDVPTYVMAASFAAVTGVVYVLQQDVLLALLAGVGAAATVGAVSSNDQIRRIAKMEAEIPHVIRTMITKKEKGIDLVRILKEIPADRGLSRSTAESFRILTKRITSHDGVNADMYQSPSGLMSIVNFVTHSITSSGGGDRLGLESFSDMVTRITHGRHLYVNSVKGSLLFLFATPVIILFATAMITLISGNSFDALRDDNTYINVDTDGVTEGLRYTIVTYSMCIGVTISRGVYNDVRVLWPLAVSAGSGAVIVGFWDVLYGIIVTGLL